VTFRLADQLQAAVGGLSRPAFLGPARGLAARLMPALHALAVWYRVLTGRARRGMERAAQLGRWLLDHSRRPAHRGAVRPQGPRAPPAPFQAPTMAPILSVVVATGPPRTRRAAGYAEGPPDPAKEGDPTTKD
jgi:hypothetical protein